MQLIQAQSIGFCFGVRRAIDMAEGILKERGSLYILGELIHNASVIRRLEALGAVNGAYPFSRGAAEGDKGLRGALAQREECHVPLC